MAVSHGDPLDLATPAGTADPREGDDRIRELKRAFFERLTLAGVYLSDSSSPNNSEGKICCDIQRGADATFPAGTWYVWATDKTTIAIDLDSTNLTFTLGDGKSGSDQYTCIAHAGDFYDVTIDNDLTIGGAMTVTGEILGPTIVRATIQGGQTDRQFGEGKNDTLTSPITGTNNTLVTTAASFTTSTDSNTPTRYLFCWFSAFGGSGDCNYRFERSLDGGSWLTAGFVHGRTTTIELDSVVSGYTNLSLFDILAIATSAQTVEVRMVADVILGSLYVQSARLLVFESMCQDLS